MKKKVNLVFFLSIIFVFFVLSFIKCREKEQVLIEYYDTGELKSKVIRNVPDTLNSVFYLFYKNGNKKVQVTFKNGKKNGKYFSYYENGQVEEIFSVINDNKHGVYKHYTKNGKLHEESLYLWNKKKLTKIFSINNELKMHRFISYQITDTVMYDIGRIVYDSNNIVINDLSFYYEVHGDDTLKINSSHIYEIEFYNKNSDFEFELSIGQLDTNLNLIETSMISRLSTMSNIIMYKFTPTIEGYNLLLGEINLKNDSLILKYPFYKEFYVE